MRLAVLLPCLSVSLFAPQTYDVLITGGRVVDGAGNPYFYADVALSGDTIAAIGRLSGSPTRLTIDARGLTITPGFIDIHNHSYPDILTEPTAKPYLYQGVTTLIGGPDGTAPLPLKPALDRLAQHKMSV